MSTRDLERISGRPLIPISKVTEQIPEVYCRLVISPQIYEAIQEEKRKFSEKLRERINRVYDETTQEFTDLINAYLNGTYAYYWSGSANKYFPVKRVPSVIMLPRDIVHPSLLIPKFSANIEMVRDGEIFTARVSDDLFCPYIPEQYVQQPESLQVARERYPRQFKEEEGLHAIRSGQFEAMMRRL